MIYNGITTPTALRKATELKGIITTKPVPYGIMQVTSKIKITDEESEAERYSYTFDESTSYKLINEANDTYGTRTNEILLTALGLATSKIADGSVGINVESHGRAELPHPVAIDHTIGWFTSCYPVVINNNSDIADELISIKETLRRIEKNGIDSLKKPCHNSSSNHPPRFVPRKNTCFPSAFMIFSPSQ